MKERALTAVAIGMFVLSGLTFSTLVLEGEPDSYPVDSVGEPAPPEDLPTWVYLIVGLTQAILGAVVLWLRKHHGYRDE